MLTVLTFKWTAPPGYRSVFTGRHVDVLRRMVRRNYDARHRFVCVTDDPRGISEPDVEIFQLWPTFGNIRNPSGSKNPSCYRRLRMFARNAGEWLGERAVCLDLDCVITGDMRPIWDDPADFKIWKSATIGNPYNGSMVLFKTGARPQLWETFDPILTPRETLAARLYGSDQAWIAYCLGPHEKTWGMGDGVFSYRLHLKHTSRLPDNARIVFFHGKPDPWSPEVYNRLAWIRENYK
jgi:hypothetical protein